MRGFVLPLSVLAGGLVVGFALWGSGLDVALQQRLWLDYNQHFNGVMRVLGWLALGRTLLWACVLGGLGWACMGRGKSREPAVAFVARVLVGIGEQVLLWLRGKWRWALRWQGVKRGPRMVLAAIPALALTGLAQIVLKVIIGRPRPKEILFNGADPYTAHPFGMHASWWSMPSGHSASVWVLAVWLGLAFPRWRWVLWSAAVVLSVSRFLSVTPHYLGDVVAGAGLGAAVALALWQAMGLEKQTYGKKVKA